MEPQDDIQSAQEREDSTMRCALYTRVSTTNQAEKEYNSCDAQRDRILSYIKSQDSMEIYKEYSDPGFSASTIDRPAFTELLRDIANKNIDAVLTYKIDRLTRSSRDFYNLIEYFEKYNVSYISISEHFDTSSAAGRLLRNIMLTFAQFEREMTSERVRDKVEQRAKKGLWSGGAVPIGYKAVNKRLEIDKRWATVVRSIYDDFASTGCVRQTMRGLREAEVIHPKTNKIISISTVAYILRNPVYTGKVRWNGQAMDGEHQAIISQELFDRAQSLTKEPNKKRHLYKEFLLSSVVKCSHCSKTMTNTFTNKKDSRYYYYRCTNNIKGVCDCPIKQVNAEKLERFLFESLLRISQDPGYLESLALNYSIEITRHLGLELTREYSKKLSARVQQVLKTAVERIPRSHQTDKALIYERLLERVTFSKQSMEVIVVLGDTHKSTRLGVAEGVSGAAAARVREGRPDRPTPDYSPGSKSEMVGELGLEPRLSDSESLVLPLHYSPMKAGKTERTLKISVLKNHCP
jgi:site-specific DNA recombinase